MCYKEACFKLKNSKQDLLSIVVHDRVTMKNKMTHGSMLNQVNSPAMLRSIAPATSRFI